MTSGSFLPQEGSPLTHPHSPPTKRDLKSWWKSFKAQKHPDTTTVSARPSGIFGVPLYESIKYANVAISLVDEENRSYIYGYVPIVVAKCGVFLKEKATSVEGIFRLSGSEKRIKELKTIFDSPDRYGKGLVWDGYTVHDAANVLRRYLNDLPEPVVPLERYEKFRQPLKGANMVSPSKEEHNHTLVNMDPNEVISSYHTLITELPPLNRQLLLYLLDLLAVFAAKSDENRMNSQNLAAIFQPGMLSHPNHDMLPEEYRLNQSVIIFLIENQDHFLIGMQGTEADAQTVKDLQKPLPQRIEIVGAPAQLCPSSGLARSASNASAGAESVRRDGKVRRNRSVSSRHSRTDSGAMTPRTPTIISTPSTSGGLGRSNTVPSKKSPALAAGRFQRESPRDTASTLDVINDDNIGEDQDLQTPSRTATLRPKPANLSVQPESPSNGTISGMTTPAAVYGDHSQERLLEPTTPSRIQLRSPTTTDSPDKRQPNKLRKKRIPGSVNPSAHSSTTSLPRSASASPMYEIPNPLETIPYGSPAQNLQARSQQQAQNSVSRSSSPTPRRPQVPAGIDVHIQPNTPTSPPLGQMTYQSMTGAADTVANSQGNNQGSRAGSSGGLGNGYGHGGSTGNLLKTKKSPPTSLHSSFNESDIDPIDEASQHSGAAAAPPVTPGEPDKEKKRRWRLSRPRKEDMQGIMAPLTSPRMALGLNSNADASNSSIASGLNRGLKISTSTNESGESNGSSHEILSASEDRGLGWIKNKYREAKDLVDQKIVDQWRARSPPPTETHFSLDAKLASSSSHLRGRSFDMPRPEKTHDTAREHSAAAAAAQQSMKSPKIPPRPGSDHEINRPDLPPRTSHESHRVPVGPRKPVPGHASAGTTTPSVSSTPAPASPVSASTPEGTSELPPVPESKKAPAPAPAPVQPVIKAPAVAVPEAVAIAAIDSAVPLVAPKPVAPTPVENVVEAVEAKGEEVSEVKAAAPATQVVEKSGYM